MRLVVQDAGEEAALAGECGRGELQATDGGTLGDAGGMRIAVHYRTYGPWGGRAGECGTGTETR